jgi:hypothetical protein
MALQNFQYSLNGLTFGAGTDVQIVQEEGLRSLPDIRSQDIDQPRNDGFFAGWNYFGERIVTLTLAVSVTKFADFETVVSNLTTAFQSVSDPNAQQVLQFMYPGWATPRQVIGRVTRVGFPTNLNYSFHKIDALPVEFTCNDPLVYDSVLQTVSTGLPNPGAGLTFDVSFDATFGASSGGVMSLTNAGNTPAHAVFTIQGPCVNPSLLLSNTGEWFGLNITLTAADTLVVDMGNATVILNGTASRFNAVRTGSTWFGLPSGASSIQVASQDAGVTSAVFTARYRSAWGWV